MTKSEVLQRTYNTKNYGIKIEPNQEWLSKEGGHLVKVIDVTDSSVRIDAIGQILLPYWIPRTQLREKYDPWVFLNV